MKCTRCAAEVPGQAQFCMRCGTPVAVGRPGGPVMAAAPAGVTYASRPSRSKLPAILAAIGLLAVIGAVIAFKMRPNAKVADVNAKGIGTGALTDINARVHDTGPLARDTGTVAPGPADPTDIIDYLKHVRDTERQRVLLTKQQTSQALNWSAQMQGKTLSAYMTDDPDTANKKNYGDFQGSFSKWSTEWEALSRQFLAYPKPVPQSCTQLRDEYLDVLGKTSATMTTVGNAFAKGMSGDPGQALDVLTRAQGSASADIDNACSKADSEVASVCDKYKIHKDFDIKPDGGASNPFGVGR